MRAPEQVGMLSGRAVCGSGNHLYLLALLGMLARLTVQVYKLSSGKYMVDVLIPQATVGAGEQGHSGSASPRFPDRGRRSRRCRRRCSSCGDSRSGRRVGERERERERERAHTRNRDHTHEISCFPEAVAANIVLRPSPASGPEATPEASTPRQACRHPGASGPLDFTSGESPWSLALLKSRCSSLSGRAAEHKGPGRGGSAVFRDLLCVVGRHMHISPWNYQAMAIHKALLQALIALAPLLCFF